MYKLIIRGGIDHEKHYIVMRGRNVNQYAGTADEGSCAGRKI